MDESFTLNLEMAEIQALWRACIEYEKALQLAALRDLTLVGGELTHLENVKEKISLTFFYPPKEG